MQKQIKKYGGTLVISFSAEERHIFDIHQGDIMEVTKSSLFENKSSQELPEQSGEVIQEQ